MNNNGYGMIKQTQETWLESRYHASDQKSLYFPDIGQIAKAHGIDYIEKITDLSEFGKIKRALNYDGPSLCDVSIHPEARIYPKLTFGRPIEDSSPLLSREEFKKNMIIKYD
jgi:acetolactate synthase-1/2/3 large subunit